MKCPKCGYNSFEYLESCKKCGKELEEVRSRFNLRSLLFPVKGAPAVPVLAEEMAEISTGPATVADESGSSAEAVDFGYDFMEEEPPATTAGSPVGEADEFELDWSDQTAGQEEKRTASDEGVLAGDAGEFSFDEPESPGAAAGQEAADVFSFEDVGDGDGDAFSFGGDEDEDAPTRESQPQASGPDEFSFDEPDQESALSWDEEPLPDLSLEPGDDSALELPAEAAEEGFSFSEEEEAADFELEGSERMDQGENALPALDDLDFESLGDEEPADREEHEKKTEKPKGATEEGPSDPFDRKESSALQEAPLPAAEAGSLLPGVSARLGAFWVDMMLVTGVFLLFLMAGTRLLSPVGQDALLPSLQAVLAVSVPYYLLLFLLCFAYFTVFHFWFGQTPGKMFFGLRLEASDGGTPQLSEAFLHTVGGLVSLLTLGAGFLFALVDPQGRGWNDRLAGTRLVLAPLEEEA